MDLRTLLLVDHGPAAGRALCAALSSWRIVAMPDRAGALRALRAYRPPVAALSHALPVLELIGDILGAAPATKVILLGSGDRAVAARAAAQGAFDVCHDPDDAEDLAALVERAHRRFVLEEEGRRLEGAALPSLRAVRDAAERRAVQQALAQAGGNLSAAARLLEISRPTLYNLIRQHGLRPAEA